MRTQAQISRTKKRNSRTGKFSKNPCECCAKGAPMDNYFSDVREGAQFIV